jgi:hypothetical protein
MGGGLRVYLRAYVRAYLRARVYGSGGAQARRRAHRSSLRSDSSRSAFGAGRANSSAIVIALIA